MGAEREDKNDGSDRREKEGRSTLRRPPFFDLWEVENFNWRDRALRRTCMMVDSEMPCSASALLRDTSACRQYRKR